MDSCTGLEVTYIFDKSHYTYRARVIYYYYKKP